MSTDFGVGVVNEGKYYFISYKTEDSKRVARYVRNMVSRGMPIWYDNGILVGDLWEKVIFEKIQDCEAVILFLSANVFKNGKTYVYKEWEKAISYGKKIYPVLLEEIENNDIHPDCKEWWDEIGKIQTVSIPEEGLDACVEKILKVVGYKDNSVVIFGEDLDDYVFESGTLKSYKGTKNEIKLPFGITDIADNAFYNCSSITSIEISDSVKNIGSFAFSNCTSLVSVAIPDSVIEIGKNAFSDCTSLTSITIPDSVKRIGENIFIGCHRLVEIINNSSIEINTNGYSNISRYPYFSHGAKSLLEVHDGESRIVKYNDYLFYSYEGVNYLIDYVGKDTVLTLPESYNGENYVINNYAFCSCLSLTSVTVPDGIKSINDYVFSGCKSLTSIALPGSITSIGKGAFSYCSLLSCVNIPDSVTSIGDMAFYDCISLTSIDIPDGVISIGKLVFYNCYSLISAVIPDSVTSIGSGAFKKCKSLKSIGIPDSVTDIDSSAFFGCTSLASVVIPKGVTYIDNYTFNGCTSLTDVLLHNDVTDIGVLAFGNCTSLVSIAIPEGVTYICESAFSGCENLEEVVIPGSVSVIGKNAFRNCKKLKNIRYCGSEEDWNKIEIESRIASSGQKYTLHFNSK